MKAPDIADLLPEVLRSTAVPGSPMAAVLEVMEDLHAPVERVLDELDRYVQPYRCPDDFVPLLAHWLDLDRLLIEPGSEHARFASGDGQLRSLVAVAAALARWRGTARGITGFLEAATGVTGYEVVERAFHIRVVAPSSAGHFRPLIEQIVSMERPAHTTWDVAIAGDEEE